MADPGVAPRPLRVLIVDDSGATRLAMSSAMNRLAGVELVGAVSGIQEALQKISDLVPDVVTVDKNLDDEDGGDLIEQIHAHYPTVVPILVSGMTPEQVAPTLERFGDRPVDFLGKPSRKMRFDEWVDGPLAAAMDRARRAVRGLAKALTERRTRPANVIQYWPDLILVGASTGGPAAVRQFLAGLPPTCGAPVVIAQHMPPVFTRVFAEQLNRQLDWTVHEAAAGQVVRPGGVWIAPGDRHITLSREGKTWTVQLDDRPHLHGCRPAVDHLFTSVAERFSGAIAVVVLTGMGVDGRAGCQRLREQGGQNVRILAQNEASSAVYGMPAAVSEAGLADGTGVPEDLGMMLRFERTSARRRP
jgi:two-component system chemotaxis response regulator CheB